MPEVHCLGRTGVPAIPCKCVVSNVVSVILIFVKQLIINIIIQQNGAVGENRTHDLSLTKGLRYHYATAATVVLAGIARVPIISPKVQAKALHDGAGAGCAAIT